MPDEYLEIQEDDDILKDLFLPEDEKGAGDELDSQAVKDLKAELDEMKRQNNGLLQTVKSDRRKRQDMSSKFDGLKETVDTILTRREEGEQALADASSVQDVIDVEITDNGDAFIPKSKLDDLVSPMQSRIDELEERLQLANQSNVAARETEQLIQEMVAKDERYGPTYGKYRNARKWVNDRVVDFQRDHGIQGEIPSGQVMSNIVDDAMSNEFSQLFPGMDLGLVTTAEDSEWHFKQMLAQTTESLAPKATPNDNRFRQVLNKPSG
ncbi:MAG: hypothetical protein DRI65_13860, partial [Chloroflexota bacterium]